MKTTAQKNYGVTGIQCDFNIMDCCEASQVLDRINSLTANREAREAGCFSINQDGIEEALCLLEMVANLLSKIALEPSEHASIFTSKEEEESK